MSTNRRKKNSKVKSTVNEQLDRASAQLRMAGQRIGKLHSQWKSYLYFLSFAVMYLSYHQMRKRLKICSDHLALAAVENDIARLGMDSATLIIGLVLSILLCFFLRSCSNTVTTFAHPIFLTAQISALSATVLYWMRMSSKDDGLLSCLEPETWTDDIREIILAANDTVPFPCSVVFHVVVSLSLWFMNYQRQQHLTNVAKVEAMRDEINAQASKKQK